MSNRAHEYQPCLVPAIPDDCLNCPLPQCKYDDPAGYQRWLRVGKLTEALELKNQGMSAQEAAQELDVTPRTVFRLWARRGEVVGSGR